MNGYVVNLRLRRAGALGGTERTYSVSDKDLSRLGRQALFVLGVFLLVAAPFAMAALTMPERAQNQRIAYQNFVGDWAE